MKQLSIRVIQAPDDYNPFMVIEKPSGLASAPLTADDTENAFRQAAAVFPQLLSVAGRKPVEHGLLHRIDTATKGLLLIAATQQAYDVLLQAQESGRFIKKYNAVCDIIRNCSDALCGFPPVSPQYLSDIFAGKDCILSTRFRPFGTGHTAVRPVTAFSSHTVQKKAGPVLYTTKISLNNKAEIFSSSQIALVCTITAGYRHQVRCHLAWIGLPICGDRLYNPTATKKSEFEFTASAIEFPHPLTGKKQAFFL